MLRTLMVGALFAAAVALSPTAFAQQGQFGSAAEAKAMLERAIKELKVNEAAAIEKFNKGEAGFRDRDLYLFCFKMNDGKVVAHVAPDQIGVDVRTVKDATGKVFGRELYDAAHENLITEVSYRYPRPGSEVPAPKVSYVTRVGNVGCGVGYYK
jgi:signal transduction histidine kinase